jgi:hypothetical protein
VYQGKERGLKGILCIMLVLEDAATHAQDHRAVTADERFKRGLVVPVDETF